MSIGAAILSYISSHVYAQVVIGAGITLLLGSFTGMIADRVETDAKKKVSNGSQPTYPRNAGDRIFGYLECLLFFGSFWMGSAVLASAWLVFKTAAKWKTWDSVANIKGVNPNNTIGEITARYKVFLAGTTVNIVAALVGAGVAHVLGPN
jgi:hypothetical protein